VLAAALQEKGLQIVGGGTQTHLMIIDLRNWGGGTQLAAAMAAAGLFANKNTVPDEPHSPFYPSGVRIGTPAVTTRGMQEKEMEQIAAWIAEIESLTKKFSLPSDKLERRQLVKEVKQWAAQQARLKEIREEVGELCRQFPVA